MLVTSTASAKLVNMILSPKLAVVFRRKLRERLEEIEWSQQDLANQLGVGKSYVSQLMTGHRNPGLDTLESVAKAVNVEATWLISEKIAV